MNERAENLRQILSLEQRARAESRRKLPMLRVELASPCDVPWESMKGDGKNRFCDTCTKTVHDLTVMTPDEIAKFLAAPENTTACVRVYERHDGTVMREDCAFGLRRRRLRSVLVSGLSLAAVAFGCFTGLALLDAKDARATTRLEPTTSHASGVAVEPVAKPKPGLLTVLAPPGATVIVDDTTLGKNVANIPVTANVRHVVKVIDPKTGFSDSRAVTIEPGKLQTLSIFPVTVPIARPGGKGAARWNPNDI